jgi:hypothetical protein
MYVPGSRISTLEKTSFLSSKVKQTSNRKPTSDLHNSDREITRGPDGSKHTLGPNFKSLSGIKDPRVIRDLSHLHLTGGDNAGELAQRIHGQSQKELELRDGGRHKYFMRFGSREWAFRFNRYGKYVIHGYSAPKL